jgi:hypothetical protein
MLRHAIAVVLGLAVASCAPKARPLAGAPAPAQLPQTQMATRPQRVVFRWEYAEESVGARGEGVARMAPPDSARLDFFLDGGLGGGYAILIDDALTVPGGDAIKRLLPPAPRDARAPPRGAVPALPDTVARVSGDTLRADIGGSNGWRATFVDGRLSRLDRVNAGRLVEWVSRSADGVVRYHHESARRTLGLNVTRTEEVSGHAASIWNR